MKHYKPQHQSVLPSQIVALVEARPYVAHFADMDDTGAAERAQRVLTVIDAALAAWVPHKG